jgi:hypothetical protein
MALRLFSFKDNLAYKVIGRYGNPGTRGAAIGLPGTAGKESAGIWYDKRVTKRVHFTL